MSGGGTCKEERRQTIRENEKKAQEELKRSKGLSLYMYRAIYRKLIYSCAHKSHIAMPHVGCLTRALERAPIAWEICYTK